MCRYPVLSAASTAVAVSSGDDWNTPSPMAGMVTLLLRTRSSMAALTITSVASMYAMTLSSSANRPGPTRLSFRVVRSSCTMASASCDQLMPFDGDLAARFLASARAAGGIADTAHVAPWGYLRYGAPDLGQL